MNQATDVFGLMSGGREDTYYNAFGHDIHTLSSVGPEVEPLQAGHYTHEEKLVWQKAAAVAGNMRREAERELSKVREQLTRQAATIAERGDEITRLQRRVSELVAERNAKPTLPAEVTEEMVTAFIGHDSHLKDTRNTVRKRLAAALRAAPKPKPRLGERLVTGLTELAEGLEAEQPDRPPAGGGLMPLPTREEIRDGLREAFRAGYNGAADDTVTDARAAGYLAEADYILGLLAKHARPAAPAVPAVSLRGLVSEMQTHLCNAKHTAWEDAARAAARYCGREVTE